ncbi:MAG: PTS sugar transporter subunit IIA [Candidatus Latescibacterota bacterium]
MYTQSMVCRDARTARQGLGLLAALADPELIVPSLGSANKIGAIKELVDRLHVRGMVNDSLSFLQAVLERENLESTILSSSVALPHARSRAVNRLGMAVGVARPPLDFPSGDDRRPVDLICLIAIPAHAPGSYLALLGSLARTLGDADLKGALVNAASADELYRLLVGNLC